MWLHRRGFSVRVHHYTRVSARLSSAIRGPLAALGLQRLQSPAPRLGARVINLRAGVLAAPALRGHAVQHGAQLSGVDLLGGGPGHRYSRALRSSIIREACALVSPRWSWWL